jgi:hypothetical protein
MTNQGCSLVVVIYYILLLLSHMKEYVFKYKPTCLGCLTLFIQKIPPSYATHNQFIVYQPTCLRASRMKSFLIESDRLKLCA